MSIFDSLKQRFVCRVLLPSKKRFVMVLRLKAYRRWRMRRAADVVMLSFPKSGRTWLRLMIGRGFEQHRNLKGFNLMDLWTLQDFDPTLPRILVSHDDDPHKKKDRSPGTNRPYLDKKIIVLVRDPRDVIVSLYFAATTGNIAFEGDLSSFIDPSHGRIDTIVTYFNKWADLRTVRKGYLLVRYEDLKADIGGQLRRIFDFLGYPEISEHELRAVVEFASFDNMRRMELANTLKTPHLPGHARNENGYRTRKGQVGGFIDYLQDHEIEYLNSRIDGVLNPLFGYDSRSAVRPETQSLL